MEKDDMAKIRAVFEFDSTDSYPIDNIPVAAFNLDLLLRELVTVNIAKTFEAKSRTDWTENEKDSMLSCLESDRVLMESMLSSLKLEPHSMSMGEMYGDNSDDHDACLECGFCRTCGDCMCQVENRASTAGHEHVLDSIQEEKGERK